MLKTEQRRTDTYVQSDPMHFVSTRHQAKMRYEHLIIASGTGGRKSTQMPVKSWLRS